MKNYQIQIIIEAHKVSQAPLGYRRFQIGCLFVKYDLFNYESYTKSYIYTFWYNFDTVLYQFLDTRTSDRPLIGLNQLLIFSGLAYPSSVFPLQSL